MCDKNVHTFQWPTRAQYLNIKKSQTFLNNFSREKCLLFSAHLIFDLIFEIFEPNDYTSAASGKDC